jgi:uncharacterized protein YneF (UPF0154 family)
MIIVWKGLGWLVLVLGILGGILGTALQRHLAPEQLWPRYVGMGIAAVAILILGWFLNRRQTHDPWDGPPPVDNRLIHSLYWIPVEYWSGIVMLMVMIYGFKK